MPNLQKKQKRRAYMPEQSKGNLGTKHKAYRFYNSKRWRRISNQYRNSVPRYVEVFHDGTEVQTERPCCEVCQQRPARLTDHIVQIESDDRGLATYTGGAPYDFRNLMSMCDTCHNRKRQKERHGYSVEKKKTEGGWIPIDRGEIVQELTK